MVVDFQLPFKRVTVRVQDPNGAPVQGVQLTTSDAYNPNLLPFLGSNWAVGASYYPSWSGPLIVTDRGGPLG